jgi:PIN domain nuclease of toxin-antitoxin system
MIYVLDTHAIVWYIEDDPRLSSMAQAVLDDPASEFIISTMSLIEAQFLCAKGRFKTDAAAVYREFIDSTNCIVQQVTEQLVPLIPTNLNIHDAIIVATALFYRDVLQKPITLITKDGEITRSGLVQTLW